ncbi:TetR/AcrR family transcriptional regulator [Pseudovibrio exalbescens]|uniref:TetR/AcrR family transcriptional regulator n=1 Tax=Pseudovibrio exalbescens TaxID=197461 RepID=UPI0023652769|nr:TetR/AcrR family transcriptional regulator [Pseudovibrio exalbescens]MDD7910364.1 TetR/AcrR family transcriptional regulator [Pseudovibrio exalbescens]
MSDQDTNLTPEAFTDRQKAVLDCALQLLVEGGEKALTTAAIARAAGCSKESLYKWFGDRDGLLTAIVARQASKVRAPEALNGPFSRETLTRELYQFAENLLQVISSDVSLALNRLAIGQASRGDATLGQLLLKRGRGRIGAQTTLLLKEAMAQGYLKQSDAGSAYDVLYGLVLKDLHVRLLLGDQLKKAEQDYAAAGKQAVDDFMKLYAASTE